MTEVVLVDLNTKVTKELHEVGLAVKGIMVAYKEATKDGFQPGQDITQIIMGSFQGLTKAIEGLDKAGAEAKQAPFKASVGVVVPVLEGIEVILEKKESEEASA